MISALQEEPLINPEFSSRVTSPLIEPGDTYFDMSNYKKGIVWVNGHNLGRYWDLGPQKRLFCPASFLRPGLNEIIIFDLHILEPKPFTGVPAME